MAKRDNNTLEEILNEREFTDKILTYAKIGAFLGITGLFIYFKGYYRGYGYGYGRALNDIENTFSEIFEELVKATIPIK